MPITATIFFVLWTIFILILAHIKHKRDIKKISKYYKNQYSKDYRKYID